MTTTNLRHIARLMAAHEAMPRNWKVGDLQEVPAALADEYADAILGAPASYWIEVERIEPGTGFALLAWAQDHIEQRDYPLFFAMLAEIGRIRDEQGDEASAAPEHAELFMEMMRIAPPRYQEEVEEILAKALPTATHVTADGQPVYSAGQLSDKLGYPIEEVEQGFQRLEDIGLLATRYTGPVYPVQ
ncbi:hypothetical protein [Acidovorax sp.]|uniref:hypothetical protein n=1 Tax=Acidovorax sp. TaxID=1872122 RepID=UPI0025C41EDF|nr:hypothetical protein [Acidovorax sp.]MBW8461147.1 hypothetical protein [Acidovorax sp.]